MANKVLNRWCRELAKGAGVRCVTSHGARHIAGSSYAITGAGQTVIGALAGHSDSASTERCTHVAPSATTAMVHVDGPGPVNAAVWWEWWRVIDVWPVWVDFRRSVG
jgi:integrase